MKTIDVCLSPDLMHLYDVRDCSVVVVDVLRATSCMVTAFAHGVQSITPYSDVEECKAAKSQGFITSGEREGRKVDGCDKGNSPFEYMGPDIRGRKIAYTTTNGTEAIHKASGARKLVVGSFLNLSAVADDLRPGESSVLIVCAGWKGRVNLEDTLFAGAVVQKLKDDFEVDCDAPLAAQRLYNLARRDMLAFIRDSAHVKRLNRLDIHKDIEFCLKEDQYPVVPTLVNGVLTA
jgi:2-phosphosulfolactate phosphatase